MIGRGDGVNHFVRASRSGGRGAESDVITNINTAGGRLETFNHKDYVI